MLASQLARCIRFGSMSLLQCDLCVRGRCGYGVLQAIETVERKIIPFRRIPSLLHPKELLLGQFQLFLGSHRSNSTSFPPLCESICLRNRPSPCARNAHSPSCHCSTDTDRARNSECFSFLLQFS